MFKTTKAKVIFTSVICTICIIVTILLIVYNKIDIDNKNVEGNETQNDPNVITKEISGIDLKGTYNQNDIKAEEKNIKKDKVEIYYYQIRGLENKIIQDNINRDIEQFVLNCYQDEIGDLNNVVNVSVATWNSASFSNTISFRVYYYAKKDDDSEDVYQNVFGLNYDLNTGEKITIDKMFTENAPVEDILRNSAYYSLVQKYSEDTLTGELVVRDYKDIEDEVAEFIQLYKKGQITDFYYSPAYIWICYKDNQEITIDMEKWADYIAIYNRYLSDNTIYETNNLGLKNVYTLATRYNDIYYYTNYQKEKNYFADITIDYQKTENNAMADKVAEETIKIVENEIERVKRLISRDDSKFYVINYHIRVYEELDPNTQQTLIKYEEIGNTYEMTIHDFEETIEPIIIKYNRQDFGGVPEYIYYFSEVLDIEPVTTIRYYNPITGEKIVI